MVPFRNRLHRLMPELAGAPPRARRAAAPAAVVMLAALGAFLVSVSGVLGDDAAKALLADVSLTVGLIAAVVVVAMRAAGGTRGWRPLAAAVACWCAGGLVSAALGTADGDA